MTHYRVECPGMWDYDLEEALGREVELEFAVVVVGASMGSAFFLKEKDGPYWSCYYNQAAGDMCCADAIKVPIEERDEQEQEWIRKSHEYLVGSYEGAEYCPCEQCEIDTDPQEWLSNLAGATDWEHWPWESYDKIPVVY